MAEERGPTVRSQPDDPERFPLVRVFALVSLITFVAIGIGVGLILRQTVESRAIEDAARSGEIAANLGVRPFLEPADLQRNFQPLPPDRIAALDESLGSSLSPNGIVRIKVWNRQHWLVYSDHEPLRGRWFAGTDVLEQAFLGARTTEITDLTAPEEREERDFGTLLAVYTPLRLDGEGRFSTNRNDEIVGAFEIYLPFAPIAADIQSDTRRLWLALGSGLAFLYLALFRIVSGAAGRLRSQTDRNLFLASHDTLTGLLNRDAFLARIQRRAAVRPGQQPERRSAATPDRPDLHSVGATDLLLVLSLDRFQIINETLGHILGDQLLSVFADRLSNEMRRNDAAARLGGDRFGVLMLDTRTSDWPTMIEALLLRLNQPIHLESLTVDISCSVGASPIERPSEAGRMLQQADIALTTAEQNHLQVEFYRSELTCDTAESLQLVSEVRDALRRGEFVLHYQPKYSLLTGAIVGSEALVRWDHPERGLLSPGIFVPAVEQLPVGRALTDYVLDLAITHAALWQAVDNVGVSVNLSARDVNDLTLPGYVAEKLAEVGLAPYLLTLELTESNSLVSEDRTIEVLEELAALGCRISIDDFGTGYASIRYLTKLPADEVKIDQSFVKELEDPGAPDDVVRHCVDLAHSLGMESVAEGIETLEVEDRLRQLGCQNGQGYGFARPMPVGEFMELMSSKKLSLGKALS